MTSATASAWQRSIFPFKKARRVNSPGWATTQPKEKQASNNSAETTTPPWQETSITSSPVYECGAGKKVRTPESISSPTGEKRGVYRAYLGLSFSLQHNFLATKYASGPLIRITARPPTPSGVAREAMVVFVLKVERASTEEAILSLLLRFLFLWV